MARFDEGRKIDTMLGFIRTLLLNYGSHICLIMVKMSAMLCFLLVSSKARLFELHEHDDVSHDDGAEAQKLPPLQVDVAQKIEWCRVGHPPR